jgi:hypothetical protein
VVASAGHWAVLFDARVVRIDRQQRPQESGQAQVLSGATQTLRLWGDDRPRQAPLIRRGADCRVALHASQRASQSTSNSQHPCQPGQELRAGEKQASAADPFSRVSSFLLRCTRSAFSSAPENQTNTVTSKYGAAQGSARRSECVLRRLLCPMFVISAVFPTQPPV